MRGVLLGFCLVWAAVANAQDLFGDGKETYVLMPADVIASGIVSNVQISRTSQYVVYQRADPPNLTDVLAGKVVGPGSWYCYDRKSKRNITISVPDNTVGLSILGDGRTAFFFGATKELPQGFIDLSSGAIKATQFDVDHLAYDGQMPFAPFLMIENESKALIIRSDGSSAEISLPPKVRLASPIGSDGKFLYIAAFRRATPLEYGKVTFSLATGEATYAACTRDQWIASNPDFQQEFKFGPDLLGGITYVKMGKVTKDTKSDLPLRAQLGLVNATPRFSYDNKFVVYQDAGALLVRTIEPIDTDAAKKMFAEAQKAVAISKAKQAALALIMYASDMDDVLPGIQGWEDKVNPYSKDRNLLNDFNYTFRGGDMNGIESPAETELGFVMGPGGRAVAYTDGHVKWIPNP